MRALRLNQAHRGLCRAEASAIRIRNDLVSLSRCFRYWLFFVPKRAARFPKLFLEPQLEEPALTSCGITPCGWRIRPAQSSRWTANGVRLLICQHVPENGRDPSHHGYPRDLRTATPLDSSVPLSHSRITLQKMQYQLPQDKPRDLLPSLVMEPNRSLALPVLRHPGVSPK